MKLASGLRYFHNPLGIDDIVETTLKNVTSEDEISISTDISCFVDDLNECENWGGKVKLKKKTERSQKDQLSKTLISDNDSSLNLPNNNQINDVGLTMNNNINIDNIIQEQSLSQTTVDVCTLIENPSSSLPQLPSKKKRSKYLNPDSEWLTIPLDQMSSPSKLGLLPNGGIIISGCGSQRKENGDTYNLSNTCGFDSIVQLMAVAFCVSSKLREQVVDFENIPGIELAITISKTNAINKNLLSKRLDI
ncbi:unnamed protein product [Macrosiphum euphorbiae]|uniref:Uncharacterized protein n=1 Tax=Macrosiphum euphorbiae TaxID=13131 RepID=A0AAV0XN70_9HEMI|nr:unnamed protein product [Macrosiphum euphorbiae]